MYRAIIILTSLVLAGCGHNGYVREANIDLSDNNVVTAGADLQYQVVGMMWNRSQYMRFSLNQSEKNLHQSSVYHALNNTLDGEITEWYSDTRPAKGQVRVIQSFPTSDGMCRIYQAHIQVNGRGKHITNKACKRLTHHWAFVY